MAGIQQADWDIVLRGEMNHSEDLESVKGVDNNAPTKKILL